jgi:hypothetical protein
MSKIVVYSLLLIAGLSTGFKYFPINHANKFSTEASNPAGTKPYLLPDKIKNAREFTEKNKLDTAIALLIDYSRHSGKKRAFLVNISKHQIIDSFLVSHGCGAHPWGLDYSKHSPTFSNQPESHCTSLGRFKIGSRGKSSWGIFIKYLLHGLDSSNNNALKRQIVLHGWSDVSDDEIFPNGTPEGWGCPAFSNSAMTVLDSTFKSRPKPVLLWSFQ